MMPPRTAMTPALSRKASPSSIPSPSAQKHACIICARRKVKCDRQIPCSNCTKARRGCVYGSPAFRPPRSKAADEGLLARLANYEELMRNNNIDFAQYSVTWVSSDLKEKVRDLDVGVTSPGPVCTIPDDPAAIAFNSTQKSEKCLWANLPNELRYSPMQRLRRKDDPFYLTAPSLKKVLSPDQAPLASLHPEPRHIYRLWQTFVERVNPLTKVVHAPTLQQRILDAICNADTAAIPASLTAILFAIYNISVTAMSTNECKDIFESDRSILLIRYRDASLRALLEAEYLSSCDMETLQASIIYLFANPETDMSISMVGSVVRLAQRLRYHVDLPLANLRTGREQHISVFEREMRIRIWWQLCALEDRICCAGHLGSPSNSIGHLRLPINVNDSDLHPDMTHAPHEQTGYTEMSPILIKLQLVYWLKANPTVGKLFERLASSKDPELFSLPVKDEAIRQLRQVYEQRLSVKIDMSIPPQRLIHFISQLSIAKLTFRVYHPRALVGRKDLNQDLYIPQDEAERIFQAGLTIMEMTLKILDDVYSKHLFGHFCDWPFLDATVYVTSELRRRVSGHGPEAAWLHVETLYNEYGHIMYDLNNSFFAGLGDIVLEAWGARSRQMLIENGGEQPRPSFIQFLREKRQCFVQNPLQNPSHIPSSGYGTRIAGINFKNPDDPQYWNFF